MHKRTRGGLLFTRSVSCEAQPGHGTGPAREGLHHLDSQRERHGAEVRLHDAAHTLREHPALHAAQQ